MFGRNKIATQKTFAFDGAFPQQVKSLKVTSIFHTLQGEGPFAGRRATFVRLTGCNLQCSFCDTYFDAGEDMKFMDILDRILRLRTNNRNELLDKDEIRSPEQPPLIVVTGGEPFLQPNLSSFLQYAHQRGYKCQVETNGNFWQEVPGLTTIVCSPKINEKTLQYVKVHPDLLARTDALKFVISTSRAGYHSIPEWALQWRMGYPHGHRRIYLSPMAEYLQQPMILEDDGSLSARSQNERVSFWTKGLIDLEKMRDNIEYAALLAMKYDAILGLQIHLFANLP
jgi:organic radical activating enzyme